jgi:SAM-dependent methyltransferase
MCGSNRFTVVAQGTDYQYGTTSKIFSWQHCSDCQHLYINPLPTPESLPILYPSNLKNYDEFDRKPGLAFRVKAFLDGRNLKALARDIAPGGRLLDVGCAAGMLLDVARKYCPNLSTIEGLDISEAACIGAKRKGYQVYVSSIEAAELKSDYYDLIYMQQVIEHVHEPAKVLTKLLGALKPGGRLVLETPHLYSLDHQLFSSGYWEGYHIPRHFNLWTEQGMRQLASRCGYSNIFVRTKIKPVHWTLSFQNWAIGTRQPELIIKFFSLGNPFLLVLFGVIDVLQLKLLGKASDVQYILIK